MQVAPIPVHIAYAIPIGISYNINFVKKHVYYIIVLHNTENWRNINMSKYLLEVGVEELPYKFIPMAISQLEAGFKTFLESSNVGFDNIKVMATPRRLAVIIEGLASSQPDVEKTVKGPIANVAYD